MIRRPAALLALALTLAIALTACASAAPPDASPSVTPSITSTPTPSPTPEVLVIAGGEKPPTVFGDDCAAALDAGVIAAVHGLESVRISPIGGSANVGGLSCKWEAADVMGYVSIITQRALGDAELSTDNTRWRFEECGWGCEWLWESDELWISGYSTDLPQVGRAEADRRGDIIGAGIVDRHLALGEVAWDRDTARWWPAMKCADLAAIVGARLDAPVTGDETGYHDPPLAETVISDIATRQTWCTFAIEGVVFASARLMPGMAWSTPSSEYTAPYPIDVTGITGYIYSAPGYLGGTAFSLRTDVNEIGIEVAESSPWGDADLVAVFAELAAGDFR
ncbi:MAG: hypothetical protein ABWY55_05765 [Microbacterium sp.]